MTSTKMIFMGHSGNGKTGALASLAAAGYKLRVVDLDMGSNILTNYCTDPLSPYVKENPNCLENVTIIPITEDLASQGFGITRTKSTVWDEVHSFLGGADKEKRNFGHISSWGDDTTLVIDSLTRLADAAKDKFLYMNGRLATKPFLEGTEWGIVAGMVEQFIEAVTLRSIKCNVIIIAHLEYIGDEAQGGVLKGFPAAIGKQVGRKLPRYFNSMLLAEVSGKVRKIYTDTHANVALKNEAPLRVAKDYPLETGLADFFRAVRASTSAS